MTGNFSLFASRYSPIQASFTLIWNETGNAIEGTYSDNVFAANAGVTGMISGGKRIFQVVFATPDLKHGVKSLQIETPDIKGMAPNLSTTILAKDINGRSIESTNILAGINQDNALTFQAQQATEQCALGFGALTGFCGLYAGNLIESNDGGNVCQLGSTRLELALNGELSFYFNYNGSLTGIPRHNFGSILGVPMSQNINTTVRHCGPLPGTNMNSAGCKTLHLVGSFQDFGSIKNFSGTYDIRDEVTGNSCGYSMNLGRDVIY